MNITTKLTVRPTQAIWVLALLTIVTITGPAFAGEPIEPAETPPDPHFNRLNDFDQIVDLLEGYHAAYPEWTELESIGKTAEGRDLWMLTINNPATGPASSKPGMYIDGNTHANEVQGAETALYTVDFVLKNYGKLARVTETLDRVAFYILPVVNADGRVRWFGEPSTPNFPRTVVQPIDDDRDGRVDEDGYEDLDGDGVITTMRKKVPMGQGNYRQHPKDSRILMQLEDGELGDWILLGQEGYDNDGDGQVNEDQIGYVDPNRTWGYSWQPRYVQAGAPAYPLQIPETRSIALWAMKHPNIAGVQSYHNSGGMILRGPSSKIQPPYPGPDIQAYDLIGEEGEKLIPGYRYFITWKDLYTVFGDTTDHFFGVHGIISFTNELYRQEVVVDFDGDEEVTDEEAMRFNDLLALGRMHIDFKEFDHPTYGKIEIGGFRQDVGRVAESWLAEEDMHRNNAFVLFHAYHLPKISMGEPTVTKLDNKLWRVEVPVLNERGTPTMTATARQGKLHRPDIATVDGATVVASGIVSSKYPERVQLQEHRPERLEVQGVDRFSTRTLFFLVEGGGEITVHFDSLKGGKLSRKVMLK